jgi:hypothetical protein
MMPVHSHEPCDAPFPRIVALRRALIAGAAVGVVCSLAVLTGGLSASSIPTSTKAPQANALPADFGPESPSPDARHLADWIADSCDNAHADFIIVDKPYAMAYVFDAQARLRGVSPVLLGSARGDDSVPGIGLRPIAEVRPEERTPPAGRFVAECGRNLKARMWSGSITTPPPRCIVCAPPFATRRAIVYVLPDIEPVQQVFGSYDVATVRRPRAAPWGRG